MEVWEPNGGISHNPNLAGDVSANWTKLGKSATMVMIETMTNSDTADIAINTSSMIMISTRPEAG